jgi:hypothetical protein
LPPAFAAIAAMADEQGVAQGMIAPLDERRHMVGFERIGRIHTTVGASMALSPPLSVAVLRAVIEGIIG